MCVNPKNNTDVRGDEKSPSLVKISKKDLKVIFGDDMEFKQDVKAFGKPLKAVGLWNRDHWEYIVVTFQNGVKVKYSFDY